MPLAVGISGGDDEAIQHGRFIRPTAGNDVVAVLTIVSEVRAVVAGQVTAQNGLVCVNIPGIRVRLTKPGVPRP